MQIIVNFLRKKNKIYKKMQEIKPSQLGVRNKIKIYHATDLKGYFTAIFVISQKSHLLIKDVKKMEEIYQKLIIFSGHNFKYKLLFIDAPLCFKAKEAFKVIDWKLEF